MSAVPDFLVRYDDEYNIRFRQENQAMPSATAQAIHLVRAQAALLTTTATGGARIDDVEGRYQENERLLRRELMRLGVENPFPWRSLWDWHGFYSGNFQRYAERRQYIASITNPTLDRLERLDGVGDLTDWGEPSPSWASLDARVDELKHELAQAKTLDGWQDVGRRSRQIIIAAADLAFTNTAMPSTREEPKGDDAKAKIEIVLEVKFPGSAHAELRHLMKSALNLANAVTHSSSITSVDAFAVAQATLLVVRCLQRVDQESTELMASEGEPDR